MQLIDILVQDYWKVAHNVKSNSYNMGMGDLPDICAQSLRAAGPRAENIHIRQITSGHVRTNL